MKYLITVLSVTVAMAGALFAANTSESPLSSADQPQRGADDLSPQAGAGGASESESSDYDSSADTEASDDEGEELKSKLEADDNLASHLENVEITVTETSVYLSGTVESESIKSDIGAAVEENTDLQVLNYLTIEP